MIENRLHLDIQAANPLPIASLIDLGRQKGSLTYDDIVEALPQIEREESYLEVVFTALINAGITIDPQDLDSNPGENGGHRKGTQVHPRPADADPANSFDPSDLVGMYFKEAARHPLLSAQEEVDLARRIERGHQAREELSNGEIPSPQGIQELQALVDDGWQAVETLVTTNSRLVISIAKKYAGRGVYFLDLIQEGNIGLIRAAKKFDYKRGFKFSTYATWWIRQAITRALADQSRTIRVPAHMSEKLAKLFRAQYLLKQELGRTPEAEEIAAVLDLSLERVTYLFQIARHPLSLEMPVSIETDSVLGDFIEDDQAPDPDETSTQNLLRQHIETVIAGLAPREAQVLRMRFGLADGTRHTLREAGDKMGVSRERIRQIEGKALQKLRQPRVRRQLRGYLGK
ncbi:MAG: sigma-70 family RNA polymerase sigma factor [Anaerolineales bacterium]|nr:sigma-70 family RNA polymerase sigma factor [Anaerolineales bacterium]